MTKGQKTKRKLARIEFLNKLSNIEFNDEYQIDRFNEDSIYITFRDSNRNKYQYFPGAEKCQIAKNNTWVELSHDEFFDKVKRVELF